MILTIEVSPEIDRLVRAAAAQGDTSAARGLLMNAVAPIVDATVDELLHLAVAGPTRRADGLTDEEFDRLLDEVSEATEDLPPLSDYAVSREGIYEDHP